MSEYNELFTALAKAQMEMTNAEKNTDNAYLKSKYADLSSVMDAARPHLSKNGLCVIQVITEVDGVEYLKTILGHSSGQSIESNIKLVAKADPNNTKTNYYHALGSALSYLRRYSYCAIVGVAVGTNDDDGNASVPQNYRPPVKAAHAAAAVLISDDDVYRLETLIGDNVELLNDALLKGKISDLRQLEQSRLSGFIQWIEKEKSKRAEAEDFIL
jgi:hypothetical protein